MKGISAFMNSSFADIQIRCICGGTMVNKGDSEASIAKPREFSEIRKMLESAADAKELDGLINIVCSDWRTVYSIVGKSISVHGRASGTRANPK